MSKPLRVAGEVDSWCTRCRLLLNHRIVSMKVGKPYQVECLTCRSQHIWRPHAPGAKPASSGSERTSSAAAGASRRTSARPSAQKQGRQWEQAILGRAVHEFKTYSADASFLEGDLVRHRKFGDGIVTRVIDAKKVEVLFQDEARTLAQALTS
jgi:hypothetical protein